MEMAAHSSPSMATSDGFERLEGYPTLLLSYTLQCQDHHGSVPRELTLLVLWMDALICHMRSIGW
jgi:hypothetical protein